MLEMFNRYLGKEWKTSSHKCLQCYYCSLLTGDGVSFQRDSHTVAARISWQRSLPRAEALLKLAFMQQRVRQNIPALYPNSATEVCTMLYTLSKPLPQ